jgi:hypothetical protein
MAQLFVFAYVVMRTKSQKEEKKNEQKVKKVKGGPKPNF